MISIYSQNICDGGHYFVGASFRSFCAPDALVKNICPICGKEAIWNNWVENSSLDHFGYIPPELLEVTPTVVTRTCKKNSEGVYEEVICTIVGTYRVPTESEVNDIRGYVYNGVICSCISDKVLSVKIPS